MISCEFVSRLRLVAIHVRDPDGIRRDPKGELPQNRARAQGFPYKTLEPWRDPRGSERIDSSQFAFRPRLVAIHVRVLTGSHGIRRASYRKILLARKASRTKSFSRGGIRRDPKIMMSLQSCCRLRPVAFDERDPCGIRKGSNGIRGDPGSMVLLIVLPLTGCRDEFLPLVSH